MDEKKPNNAGAYYRKCENYTRIVARMKSVLPRPAVVSRVFTGNAVLRHLDHRFPEAVAAAGQAVRTYPDRRDMLNRMSALTTAAADAARDTGNYAVAAGRYATAMELTSARTITRRTSRMVDRLRSGITKDYD